MGRSKRNRSPKPSFKSADGLLTPKAWGSGYDAANRSTRRGRIDWSTLETSDELPKWAREDLLRSGRWLKANVGFIKGLIKNSAMFIGWLTPHAQSTDIAWNKLRDKSFLARNKAKIVFDNAGKFNFRTAQTMMVERALGDGDILCVLTETPSGGARLAFYEAHQLANPKDADAKVWRDGVRINKAGNHIAYGVKDGDTVKIIEARDAFLFGKFDSVGHVRPHPPLAHAITNMVDVTETRGFLKLALKNSSLMGIVEEMDGGSNPNRAIGGMDTVALPGKPSTITTSDDTVVKTAQVFDGGQVQQTRPGSKYRILADERPHPNHVAYEEVIIRDIALGWGLPFEVVYSMYKLTGPGVRFVMAVAEKWIEQWQGELHDFVHRYWVYDTAKEIKAGRLPQCEDPDWMQKVKCTTRRSMTIDRGKEGKQRLDELSSGAATLADWCEETSGDDWRDHVDQVTEEHDYKVKACAAKGYTLDEVFKPRQGTATIDTEPKDATDPDESPDPPDDY
jgi:capsid protein